MATLNLKIDKNGNLINIKNNEIILGRSSLFDDGQWETQEDGITCIVDSTVTKSNKPYEVADFDTYDTIKYYFSVSVPVITSSLKNVLWCTDIYNTDGGNSGAMLYSPSGYTKYYLYFDGTKDVEFTNGTYYGCIIYKKLSSLSVECTLILLNDSGSVIYKKTIESTYFNGKFYFSTGIDSYFSGTYYYIKDSKFYEDISPILAVVPLDNPEVHYLDLQGVSWFWAKIKKLVETNGSVDLSDYYTKAEVDYLLSQVSSGGSGSLLAEPYANVTDVSNTINTYEELSNG